MIGNNFYVSLCDKPLLKLFLMPHHSAIPLTDNEFSCLMALVGPFEPNPHICVAVSGGPDSLALSYLLQRWVSQCNGKLTALIVDHGLRQESKHEAEKVQAWLHQWQIPTQILNWNGEKPHHKIQEQARVKRYQLLSEWCQQAGIWHLFLGHHQDDQLETLLQRLSHASGVAGLSGMKTSIWLGSTRLLRPLLTIPKARLLATLGQIKHPYITDPSNTNPAFNRSHWRQVLPHLNQLGLTGTHLQKVAQSSNDCQNALEHQWATFLAHNVSLSQLASLRFNFKAFLQMPIAVQELGLQRIILSLAAPLYPPGRQQITTLNEQILHRKALTSGGCYWWHQGDDIVVTRELRSIIPQQQFSPWWDNRFTLKPYKILQGCTIRPLGRQLAEKYAASLRYHPRILATLPTLYEAEKLISFPHFDNLSSDLVITMKLKYSLCNHKL